MLEVASRRGEIGLLQPILQATRLDDSVWRGRRWTSVRALHTSLSVAQRLIRLSWSSERTGFRRLGWPSSSPAPLPGAGEAAGSL